MAGRSTKFGSEFIRWLPGLFFSFVRVIVRVEFFLRQVSVTRKRYVFPRLLLRLFRFMLYAAFRGDLPWKRPSRPEEPTRAAMHLRTCGSYFRRASSGATGDSGSDTGLAVARPISAAASFNYYHYSPVVAAAPTTATTAAYTELRPAARHSTSSAYVYSPRRRFDDILRNSSKSPQVPARFPSNICYHTAAFNRA